MDGGYKDNKDNFLIYIQDNLDCCGVEGPNDWLNAKEWNCHENSKQLPLSCCKDTETKCYLQSASPTTLSPLLNKTDDNTVKRLTNGCYDQLLKGTYLLGTVSIAIFFFQLTVLFLAIYFIRKIKEDSSVLIF